MKTAVSIPDDLFAQADSLAQRLGMSRSQVYRDALAEYVAKHEPGAVSAALDAALAEIGPEHDPWVTEAARLALSRVEW